MHLAISIKRATAHSAGRIGLKPDDRITICVHNRSAVPVSERCSYFAPDWSITRIWPDGDTAYAELRPTGDNGFEVQVMEASLPPGVASSIDRLKLFATQSNRPTSFDLLQLGTLDVARAVTRAGAPARRMSWRPLGVGGWRDDHARPGPRRPHRRLGHRRAGTGDLGGLMPRCVFRSLQLSMHSL